MKGFTKLFVLLAICHTFVQQIAGEEMKGKALIQKVCAKTQKKDLCVQTLEKNKTSADANLIDLAMISMKAAAAHATDLINHVKFMINDEDLNPIIQQGLADCKRTLYDTEDQLQDAVAAVLIDKPADAQIWLRAALAAITTCEASLKGHDDILYGKEEELRNYCNISMAICDDLSAGAH